MDIINLVFKENTFIEDYNLLNILDKETRKSKHLSEYLAQRNKNKQWERRVLDIIFYKIVSEMQLWRFYHLRPKISVAYNKRVMCL